MEICNSSGLTEEEVCLLVAEAEDGQRLAARSELPVGHVVSGMDQFDQASLPAGCQDAAVLSRGLSPPGHQHGGPGQGEELLRRGTTLNASGFLHQHSNLPDIDIRSSRLHHHRFQSRCYKVNTHDYNMSLKIQT